MSAKTSTLFDDLAGFFFRDTGRGWSSAGSHSPPAGLEFAMILT